MFAPIDLTTIGATGLTINAGGDGESLTLNTTTAGTVNVSGTQVQRTGNGAVIYTGLANLIVNGTSGTDILNVLSTATNTATTINAGSGFDVFGAIDLTTIAAAGLTVNAGGDGELLTLNTTTAGTVTISNSLVQRTGNGTVSYTGVLNLAVNGTAGADTFNVLNTAAGVTTTLNSGAANDVVTIGNAGSLAGILGALVIHGEGNFATPTTTLMCGAATNMLAVGDTLHFDDSSTVAGQTYSLDVGTLARTGIVSISFDGMETIALDAGAGRRRRDGREYTAASESNGQWQWRSECHHACCERIAKQSDNQRRAGRRYHQSAQCGDRKHRARQRRRRQRHV